MLLRTDFHIHSHYSLATSSQLTPVYLDYWAKIKGLDIVATGDFTHPKWLSELKETLVPTDEGFFVLKNDLRLPNIISKSVDTRFILSAEISNIYRKDNKIRKVHNVVLARSFETVEKIQKKLENLNFNITSDGRPILGLDSEKLLEMLLEIDDQIIFVPAHIWTPWFSALGSKSGFDSIEQCYGSMCKYIYAVETGLSSDQPLNWLCSFLDNYCLLSNSDAHSPEKLGRNANIFDIEMSYDAILKALKNQSSADFVGTIDMYPQEGKYHYDGHRKCNFVCSPTITMQHNGICPVCGSKLTLGVAHRIAELADRDNPMLRPIHKQFFYAIPLKEILAQIYQKKPESPKIDKLYFELIGKIGNELDILLNVDIATIARKAGDMLAEAIRRLRSNEVIIQEGYDGEYGKIKLFTDSEIKSFATGSFVFDTKHNSVKEHKLLNFDVQLFRQLKSQSYSAVSQTNEVTKDNNDQQQLAITSSEQNIFVAAGPGAGKTYVLTRRILYILSNFANTKILAVTFSRQAQYELQQRLQTLLDNKVPENIKISTFHALGLEILQNFYNNKLLIINDTEKIRLLKNLGYNHKTASQLVEKFSLHKNTLQNFDEQQYQKDFGLYQKNLEEAWCVDFDDLIFKVLQLSQTNGQKFPHFDFILIDEFQDLNNAQYEFLKLLCTADTSIFAIGDANQSIYGFRGSNPKLIDRFVDQFNAQKITLQQSYRCTTNILNAATDVLSNGQKLKSLQQGNKISIAQFPSDKSEAEFIARTISRKLGGTNLFAIDSNVANGEEAAEISSLSDFAILVRTKNIIPTLTKALNDHKIPYTVVDTQSVFTQEPFATINSMLKYVVNPNNRLFYDIFTSIAQGKYLYNSDLSLAENIQKIWDLFFAQTYSNFNKIFEQYIKLSEDKTIEAFIDDIEQMTGQDDLIFSTESVKVMTIHASKGLEFQCVFVAGLEEGILPYSQYTNEADIDEERRLLYVAMTRSRNYLFLTHCKSRILNNQKQNLLPSRFLSLIKKKNYTQVVENQTKSKDDDHTLF